MHLHTHMQEYIEQQVLDLRCSRIQLLFQQLSYVIQPHYHIVTGYTQGPSPTLETTSCFACATPQINFARKDVERHLVSQIISKLEIYLILKSHYIVTACSLTFFMKDNKQILISLWKKKTSFLISFIKFISKRNDFIIKNVKNRKVTL